MLRVAKEATATAGFRGPIGRLLADAGYGSEANVTAPPADGPELLIAPTTGSPLKEPRRPPLGRIPARASPRERMARRLATKRGAAPYRRRGAIVESVFGQIKEGRGMRRFRRRGIGPCAAEWKLVCSTHNLLKLWRAGRHRRSAPHPPRRPAG